MCEAQPTADSFVTHLPKKQLAAKKRNKSETKQKNIKVKNPQAALGDDEIVSGAPDPTPPKTSEVAVAAVGSKSGRSGDVSC